MPIDNFRSLKQNSTYGYDYNHHNNIYRALAYLNSKNLFINTNKEIYTIHLINTLGRNKKFKNFESSPLFEDFENFKRYLFELDNFNFKHSYNFGYHLKKSLTSFFKTGSISLRDLLVKQMNCINFFICINK